MLDQVLPRGGGLLGRRLEQGAGVGAGVAAAEQLRDGVGEGALVVSDRDRHEGTFS